MPSRPVEAELVEQAGEALAVLGDLDGLGGEAGDRHVRIGEVLGQVDGGLAPEGEDDRRRRARSAPARGRSRRGRDSVSSGSKYSRVQAS